MRYIGKASKSLEEKTICLKERKEKESIPDQGIGKCVKGKVTGSAFRARPP